MTAMSRVPEPASKEIELASAKFQRIANVVHKTAGIVLQDSKRPLVYSRSPSASAPSA